MARKEARPQADQHQTLEVALQTCPGCGAGLRVDYHNRRQVLTLGGLVGLTLRIRRCHNPQCQLYHCPIRPEAEGAVALPNGETGLDVIALVGILRYQQHRSISEIHTELKLRAITISERSVTNQLHRYEELLALRLMDVQRLRAKLKAQGRITRSVALDGLQPDKGHEVLWVLREVLSGEVLLARTLLGATEGDLVPLIQEVQQAIAEVPIVAVVSDGQHSIRHAVAHALPGVPHQLCQFHFLREALRLVYEADRHAKVRLKEQIRGVRTIERALESETDETAQGVRDYCLAVRSALTDDGHAPLVASGLKLNERITTIQSSTGVLLVKLKAAPTAVSRTALRALERLNRMLSSALQATADLWPEVRLTFGSPGVHEAAHLLANHEQRSGTEVRAQFKRFTQRLSRQQSRAGSLAPAIRHFLKVSHSYAPGLFYCYDIADLPRTNNDLEHFFGSARYHERRITGRKVNAPGTVVRGPARLIAAVGTRLAPPSPQDLRPSSMHDWLALRQSLEFRHECRRKLLRFRRDSQAYLGQIEQAVLKSSLPT